MRPTQLRRPKRGRKCHVNYAVMLKADELELIADDPSEIPPWRHWARSIGKLAKSAAARIIWFILFDHWPWLH